jgi:hypothetical protein
VDSQNIFLKFQATKAHYYVDFFLSTPNTKNIVNIGHTIQRKTTQYMLDTTIRKQTQIM